MAKRKAKKKAKSGGKKEPLIVGSKVKAYIKSKKSMTSGELLDALSDEVRSLLDRAISRAHENGRTTVRARDL